MRLVKREIVDPMKLEEILQKAEICRLAMNDNGFPYIVPLNFGYLNQTLYFHCATEGKKLDCLRHDPRVGFEVECDVQTQASDEAACNSTTRFRSIVGQGRARLLETPEEKRHALDIIMRHYLPSGGTWNYDPEQLKQTVVIQVAIEKMTGKQSKHFL